MPVAPEFSEFSYGFALTAELERKYKGKFYGAPEFPSLIKEGTSSGYDVRLPRTGNPIFLQFKLSEYLPRKTSRQWKAHGEPYFRTYLRSRNVSKQHALLVRLNQKYKDVFYVAPAFVRSRQLNQEYLHENVSKRSAYFRPLDIGLLSDDNTHFLTFTENDNFGLAWSEPRKILKAKLENDLTGQANPKDFQPLTVNFFRNLCDESKSIWSEITNESRPHLPQQKDRDLVDLGRDDNLLLEDKIETWFVETREQGLIVASSLLRTYFGVHLAFISGEEG